MSRTKRVIQIAENECSTFNEFANILGVKKQLVSNWKNSVQEVPDKHVIRIIEEFPNVDARWLITGQGSIEEQQDQLQLKIDEIKNQYEERLALKDEIIKAKDELINVLKNKQ